MKLPVNGKWNIDHSREKGLALLATKNINFNKDGVAELSNRTIAVFNIDDDATFRSPIAAYSGPDISQIAGTSGDAFIVNIAVLPTTIAVSSATDRPALSANSSQAFFNNKWFVSENADLNSFDGTTWTDEVVSFNSGVRHPLAVHKGNNSLLVGNGAGVLQYNTAISAGQGLTLPAGTEVVGIAYNRNFAGIITWDSKNHEAWFYVWDGATAAANYTYPMGSNRAFFIVPWKNTFALLNGRGQLLQWTDSGLAQLDALPSFYTSAILADIDDRTNVAHDTSALVDGDRILFNIGTYLFQQGSEPMAYNTKMPSGIWCYDPDVGLYHRNAPSYAKMIDETIATANVNTTTNVITGTSIPATGTPLVYVSVDGTGIGGLTANTIYYVIYLSSTTFSVASTRALALAGTAIDLTSAASGFAYSFAFFPESDFGQVATQSGNYGGILTKTGPQYINTSASNFTLFEGYAFGSKNLDSNSLGAESDVFGFVMDRAQNRGWLMTQKMYSPNITDTFKKIYLKARHLLTEHDKVVVKYRTSEDINMPVFALFASAYATYTAGNQFTTTANLSAVKTAFDAGHAYEVEFLTGAGAGYLAHITAITLNGSTYTVTIDETIRNVAVGGTGYFVIDNWEKLSTKAAETAITSASNGDYSEFPIGKNASWLQLRIELQGFKVGIEEMELVNTGDKPAL